MNNRLLATISILLIVLPLASAEIVVQTLGQEAAEPTARHTFLVTKYYPPTFAPIESRPSILVEQLVSQAAITPCKEANLSFIIKNNGYQGEIFSFAIDDFVGTAFITPNLYLAPGDARLVNFILKPDCSLSGELNPRIIVETENEVAEIPVILQVQDNYNFSISLEENVSVCNNIETRHQIRIDNDADFANNFSITTSKDWVKPEYSYVEVMPGSHALVDVLIDPDFKTETSTVVNIEFEPAYGAPVVRKLTVESANCYVQEVRIPDTKVCENTERIFAEIKNRGLYEETFVLEINDGIFNLREDEITLAPGESESLPIQVDACPGKYNLELKSQIKGVPFSTELSKEIEIVTVEKCFQAELLTTRVTVSHSNETRVLELRNKGVNDELYYLELVAPEWIALDKEDVFLSRGQTSTIKIFSNPDATVPEDTYVGQLIMTSSVTEQQYVGEFSIRLSDYTFFEQLWRNKCVIALVFLILAAVVVFLKLVFDAVVLNRKWVLGDLIILFGIFILALIVIGACFDSLSSKIGLSYQDGINESQTLCETHFDEIICSSSYYIRIVEDSEVTIDLNNWFYDPDQDELTYSMSPTNHVNLRQSGSQVTLVPDNDWYGTETIVFYADDSRGGTAESRNFYIHVYDTEEFYLQNFILDNYLYLVIGSIVVCGLIILILLILLLR